MTSSAPHQSASSPAHTRRSGGRPRPIGNGSPVERVLRSDGGPGLVLGQAILVRGNFRRSGHHRRQHKQQQDEGQHQQPLRDWCQTAPLMQRVWEQGCHPALLRNRYCFGQCKSFYVPHGSTVAVGGASGGRNGTALSVVGVGRGGAAAFVSCAACKPVKFRTVLVTFVCPGQKPPLRTRPFQRVHKCRCLAVDSSP
ncbi:uncharacterized protein LOC144135471 [Amblyomma americanum]|uniref:CTCK domain-containing protein n=1 Tax=Amblyomma americanum TaxID=6943 RepID=A0AAQ4FQA3_AMBAM